MAALPQEGCPGQTRRMKKVLDNGANGHSLRAVYASDAAGGTIVYCICCGAWSQSRIKNLCRQCSGPAARGTAGREALRQSLDGKHPAPLRRGEPLSGPDRVLQDEVVAEPAESFMQPPLLSRPSGNTLVDPPNPSVLCTPPPVRQVATKRVGNDETEDRRRRRTEEASRACDRRIGVDEPAGRSADDTRLTAGQMLRIENNRRAALGRAARKAASNSEAPQGKRNTEEYDLTEEQRLCIDANRQAALSRAAKRPRTVQPDRSAEEQHRLKRDEDGGAPASQPDKKPRLSVLDDSDAEPEVEPSDNESDMDHEQLSAIRKIDTENKVLCVKTVGPASGDGNVQGVQTRGKELAPGPSRLEALRMRVLARIRAAEAG